MATIVMDYSREEGGGSVHGCVGGCIMQPTVQAARAHSLLQLTSILSRPRAASVHRGMRERSVSRAARSASEHRNASGTEKSRRRAIAARRRGLARDQSSLLDTELFGSALILLHGATAVGGGSALELADDTVPSRVSPRGCPWRGLSSKLWPGYRARLVPNYWPTRPLGSVSTLLPIKRDRVRAFTSTVVRPARIPRIILLGMLFGITNIRHLSFGRMRLQRVLPSLLHSSGVSYWMLGLGGLLVLLSS